ncbi:MAG: NifB/NifX family molybdenum-iron cluster-binding protein [Christensenellales bacterium]|jgi:predicted Fe-Mo cluster-binding NifX family protein|nr:dinitrogenase iron-molybdenum cofactor biosynthesis protein [Clostridiales bacterium]
MKIAIPVNDNNLNTDICPSFGRTAYFLIYDSETKESKFIENIAANMAGGAGIKAAQIIIDNGANVLLAIRLGQNAANVLKASDIKIYKANEGLAKDNIEAFRDGKLVSLDKFHAGFHGRGNR